MSAPKFPQAEYDLLVERFHKPFFLTKLAQDWNIVPANAAEEAQLLELAGMLRTTKQAYPETSSNPFLSEATENLKTAVSRLGIGDFPTAQAAWTKRAAAERLADPQTQAAIEAWGHYQYELAAV